MRCAIVTGATGMIGLNLTKLLLSRGYFVYAVAHPASNNRSRLSDMPRLQIIDLALADYHSLPQYIPEGADAFYHFAWEGTRGADRENVQVQQSNCRCTLDAIRAAARMGCRVFVGAGTQAEYGLTQGIVTEEHAECPETEYGRGKLQASREGRTVAQQEGIRLIWARLFSVYGALDVETMLVRYCIEKMQKNEPIDLTEGTQLWDFLYVEDAVRALAALGEAKGLNGVFNIAYGKALPLREYVLMIQKALMSQSVLNFGAINHPTGKLVSIQPSPEKLKAATGWQPRTDFPTGVQKIVKELDAQ